MRGTHQDSDHIGAAAGLKEKYPAVQILASHMEAPFTAGKLKSLRLQQGRHFKAVSRMPRRRLGNSFATDTDA